MTGEKCPYCGEMVMIKVTIMKDTGGESEPQPTAECPYCHNPIKVDTTIQPAITLPSIERGSSGKIRPSH